jgi:exoribonuclease-2
MLLWSSIDNHDSMDLDQLEYCERDPDGGIRVKIAVADVDFFVRKGSATDRHAAHNGTSVYTGVVIFPMLPDRHSKGISSLLPGKDCRAIVLEYTVLPDGSTLHHGVHRAFVRNKAKLVYEEVSAWLECRKPVPPEVRNVTGLEEQIRLQEEAACLLKSFRARQGALDLETLESEAVMEHNIVKALVIQEKNLARCLIEEFMVAANGTIVDFLGRAGIPMIQRIVRTPKNWDGIVITAAALGETLSPHPDVRALAGFLLRQKAADPERFPDLSLTIVKLLGPGEYVPLKSGAPPVGHFALAVSDYTHGTAPNRRYVDIIIQRLVKSVIDRKDPPYTGEDLQVDSAWLTDREKAAKKVERFMRKAAAAVLLRNQIGMHFDGIVTGASEKGTYARIILPPVEGRIVQGERDLRVGQKVSLRLLAADPYNGYIDFARVGKAGY